MALARRHHREPPQERTLAVPPYQPGQPVLLQANGDLIRASPESGEFG